MFNHLGVALAIFLGLAALGGCAADKPRFDLESEQALVLENTPFYPQKAYQCGPASLAMLLNASGVTVDPDDLVPYTYIPERKGSFQLELLAAGRHYDRIPYVIDPGIPALSSHIRAGRPVLILQNLGLKSLPIYHYAVVIGIRPPDTIVLHSGMSERLTMDIDRFLSTWNRAGAWGVIALKPGELPDSPDRIRYLKAVSAFEASGHLHEAQQSYEAARVLWPEDQTVLLALGNNYLSQGKYQQAESTFRELVSLYPEAIAASNNLAETLARQGCYWEALMIIEQTQHSLENRASPFEQMVHQTHGEILKALDQEPLSPGKTCAAP
ncbi:MAG: PA2778 family cysteine peptidase [Desulfofustis sp.]|nr:PA2778 family cysteine peptidase [Desulfofustis sp.]